MSIWNLELFKERHPDKDIEEFEVIHEAKLANGRSYYTCICPFCESRMQIQKWSFTTTGKKCECGAVLRSKLAVKPKRKCKCGNMEFRICNKFYDEKSLVEYDLECTMCHKVAVHWAYGQWYPAMEVSNRIGRGMD